MKQLSRHDHIVEMINAEGEVSVRGLAGELRVSEMTIRRDLNALTRQGRVLRTHGGGVPVGRISFEFEFLNRARENEAAKEAIGVAAGELVSNGQTVMLDSGTTTLVLARKLKVKKRLTVITTSLPIASTLQYCDQIQVLLLGGFVQRHAPDLGGALTESNLEKLRADAVFLGTEGIDATGNVYSASLEVARMLGKMAAAATRVYVVADHSKLGRMSLTSYGKLAHWTGLITDSGADKRLIAGYRKAGAQVIMAGLRPVR